MDHYVAYHSVERMGHDYEPGDRFSYITRKSERFLRNAIGATAWLIVGRQLEGRTHFFVGGAYVLERVDAEPDGFSIAGWGAALRPAPDISVQAWFEDLKREQSNFSFGFNKISLESAVARLKELVRIPSNEEALADREQNEVFDLKGVVDARERAMASIVRRRGQASFRELLLRAYDSRCAFSGCAIVQVLEAAHIFPYQGDATNQVQNGLLLRADLHTLFDLGLLAVDSSTMTIVASPTFRGSEHDLNGRNVNLPNRPEHHPSREALDFHRALSRLPLMP